IGHGERPPRRLRPVALRAGLVQRVVGGREAQVLVEREVGGHAPPLATVKTGYCFRSARSLGETWTTGCRSQRSRSGSANAPELTRSRCGAGPVAAGTRRGT